MHELKKEKLKRSFGLALDILFTLVLLFSISMVVSTLSMRKDFLVSDWELSNQTVWKPVICI